MSLDDGDLRTGPRPCKSRHWRQADAIAEAEAPKEPAMSNFINNVVSVLVVAAYGFATVSMFGALVAGSLGA